MTPKQPKLSSDLGINWKRFFDHTEPLSRRKCLGQLQAQWYHIFTAPGEPDGLFTIRDNQQHLERRRQANEFYTTSAVNKIAYRIDHVSRLFFDKLAHQANSEGDSPFDLCQTIRFYAYDALANITVSGSLSRES